MSGQAVLIAAFSGRALAESARRAGYVPLVVDAFGDDDTRAAAHAQQHLPQALRRGFERKDLQRALDALVAQSPAKPIGLVTGSGFEDRPRLLAALDGRYGLIGTPPSAIAEVKDPFQLSALAARLAIAFPDVRRDPPEASDAAGWLYKIAGASGGTHIRPATAVRTLRRDGYFQRRLEGEAVSVFAILGRGRALYALSRQWTLGRGARPFRYAGAVTAGTNTAADDLMFDAARKLAAAVALRGLVSFDFLVSEGVPHLLEINPRPGATLDIFETPQTPLFAAHVDACRDGAFKSAPREGARAAAILHSRDAPLTMPEITWPDWASDRTPVGAAIGPNAPIATVKSIAHRADAAVKLLNTRLAQLEDLIYRQTKR